MDAKMHAKSHLSTDSDGKTHYDVLLITENCRNYPNAMLCYSAVVQNQIHIDLKCNVGAAFLETFLTIVQDTLESFVVLYLKDRHL